MDMREGWEGREGGREGEMWGSGREGSSPGFAKEIGGMKRKKGDGRI